MVSLVDISPQPSPVLAALANTRVPNIRSAGPGAAAGISSIGQAISQMIQARREKEAEQQKAEAFATSIERRGQPGPAAGHPGLGDVAGAPGLFTPTQASGLADLVRSNPEMMGPVQQAMLGQLFKGPADVKRERDAFGVLRNVTGPGAGQEVFGGTGARVEAQRQAGLDLASTQRKEDVAHRTRTQDITLQGQAIQASNAAATRAATAAGKAKEGSKVRFDQTAKIRKEYLDQSKPFLAMSEQFTRLSSLDPTPAGDLSLIYAFQRMLSPGIVTDREVDMMARAGGLDSRIAAHYDRVVKGNLLPDDIRADFQKQAQNLFEGQLSQQQHTQKIFTDLSNSHGLDPSQVVIPIGEQGRPSPGGQQEPDFSPEAVPPGGSGQFGTMTNQQLNLVNIGSLTPAQQDAWEAELDRRGL